MKKTKATFCADKHSTFNGSEAKNINSLYKEIAAKNINGIYKEVAALLTYKNTPDCPVEQLHLMCTRLAI